MRIFNFRPYEVRFMNSRKYIRVRRLGPGTKHCCLGGLLTKKCHFTQETLTPKMQIYYFSSKENSYQGVSH